MDDDDLSDEEYAAKIKEINAKADLLYEKLRDFTKTAFHEHDSDHPAYRGIITRLIVIAEVQGDDGDFYLTTAMPSDGAPWRTRGMLDMVSSWLEID